MSLKKISEKILFSEYNYEILKEGIDELYTFFSSETSIYAGDLTHQNGIATENGWVVGQGQAAHCVKDLLRTAKFLRGVYKAIQNKLTTQSEVTLLYAGCGPYATLITPLLPFFSPEQLKITMLDINESSIQSTKELYQKNGLSDYIKNCIIGNATEANIVINDDYDIIVSETMQVILNRECQVPLTRNMVQFLKKDGVFIPEKITVDAYWTKNIETNGQIKKEKQWIGNAYTLDYKNVNQPNHQQTLMPPITDYQYIELFTTIRVFDDEVLTQGESGLTIPVTLSRFEEKHPIQIQFTYDETQSEPKLRAEYFY